MADGHSDADLVRLVKRGERAALGQLLERHQDRLFNIALRMLGHREDAADATQEALVKVIQGIEGYKSGSAFSTWMIRIAMNTAISHLRKRRVRRAVSLDGDGGDESRPGPLRERMADDREPSPDLSVERKEMLEHLKTAIAGLDEDFRSVLALRDIDQMDYQQIADVLQVPVGTVKSRLFRGRLSLRQKMLDLYGSEPVPQARREVAE
jgi:RNA polymerase sigma-70 factor (ECF subfamily)